MQLQELIIKEGWKLTKDKGKDTVIAYDRKFPLVHPFSIHAKLFRESRNPNSKYMHLKSMHDYLWPDTVWHYWTERRFQEYCQGWDYMVWAGGASTAKSYDAAKLSILFWLGNPKGRAVIIASTTLESLNSRIWGYTSMLIKEMAVEVPYKYFRQPPPKILYDKDDTIHGMFAVAAKRGSDTDAISSWIGRHPKEGMMIVLDEATDMPPAILKALPNLESGVETFHCMAIGNSLSKFDMHGALSTPNAGWESINPVTDTKWETTQKNGCCLFFSCYESPAIHETDPVRKTILSRFLITQQEIEDKEKLYGKNSDSFFRFVLGFWRNDGTDETVISRQFIDDFGVFGKAEWSGMHPLSVVGGLDPAFSTGGDQCILRLAILGQTVDGQIVLDYRDEELLFRIPIIVDKQNSVEIQIADKVLEILAKYNCPLSNVCIDANGAGRGLAEVIRLRGQVLKPAIKIYTTRLGNKAVNSFDVVIKATHELWFSFRDYIQHSQIKGLDRKTVMQLTSRLVVVKGGKQQLELKQDYKNRMGGVAPSLAHSPDEADAAALALQSAIINYGFYPGQKRDVARENSFIHDKYWVFNQLREVGNKVGAPTIRKESPPIASFTGELLDMKRFL